MSTLMQRDLAAMTAERDELRGVCEIVWHMRNDLCDYCEDEDDECDGCKWDELKRKLNTALHARQENK